MDTEAIRGAIGQYHIQLLHGCGRAMCDNVDCASCVNFEKLSSNEAAAAAIRCLTTKARLCTPIEDSSILAHRLRWHLSEGVRCKEWTSMRRYLGRVLSSSEIISRSFRQSDSQPSLCSPSPPTLSSSSSDGGSRHEAMDHDGFASHEMDQGSMTRDQSAVSLPSLSSAYAEDSNDEDLVIPTNTDAVVRCFAFLQTLDSSQFIDSAMSALRSLCTTLDFQLQYESLYEKQKTSTLHVLNVIMHMPFIEQIEFVHNGFVEMCRMFVSLAEDGKMRLARLWAAYGKEWIEERVAMVQQAITVQVLDNVDTLGGSLSRFADDRDAIPAAIQLLRIFHQSVLVASTHSRDRNPEKARREVNGGNEEDGEEYEDSELNPWMVGSALIPLLEFQNSTLSENLNVKEDFIAYKKRTHFSVMPRYAFVVSGAAKQAFLLWHNRVEMDQERRHAIQQTFQHGHLVFPYLKLTVRRDHVVRDALDLLAAMSHDEMNNFKKPLRIQFEHEQAVDEGGVSKEFYQIVIQQLFNPDYGMFVLSDTTGLYWFNPSCTGCQEEYELIGILFGLAIYNNILVDVRLPAFLYTKLLARAAGFDDLRQLDPTLHASLCELLADDEEDLESVYCYAFSISYKDVYGADNRVELKEKGETIAVTKDNRKEFVDLYADWLLNRSVEAQFSAFRDGFYKVVNRSLLRRLCLPEEVEQLVCGVLDLDFDALRRGTRYEHGFDEDSPTIAHFWTVVKELGEERGRLLLEFVTGCDRAPLGGLAKLRMVIARNGDDQTRLPSAHTCFNVLLLPEYSSLDVMRERLLKAISYSRGFGLQ